MKKKAKPGPKPLPKHLVRVSINCRIPRWLRDQVDELTGTRGQLVEQALMHHFDLEAPSNDNS